MHYIGLEVHKQSVNYCTKTVAGELVEEGQLEATREALVDWAKVQPPWRGAMEATVFSGWIHDTLAPFAEDLAVGHPAALEAISRAKKKSDRIDAAKLADLCRVNLFPRIWMAPRELRELRRLMRFRRRLVEQTTWSKNRIATLLMELGLPYVKSKLHSKSYFYPLLDGLEACDADVLLLTASRSRLEDSDQVARMIVKRLLAHRLLKQRVELLLTIPGVGEITALTWALEIGDPTRFRSINRAISYCGLCSRLDESAGKSKRGPLSKQRNARLQRADRSGQVGAALQRRAGRAARRTARERPSQPRDDRSRASDGSHFAGDRPPRHALRGARLTTCAQRLSAGPRGSVTP